VTQQCTLFIRYIGMQENATCAASWTTATNSIHLGGSHGSLTHGNISLSITDRSLVLVELSVNFVLSGFSHGCSKFLTGLIQGIIELELVAILCA